MAAGPQGMSLIVLPGGFAHHQIGGFKLHPAFGERMLDGLVLPDRPAEHDALFCIGGRALECGAAEADRFGGDQNALRIHAVENVLEAAALLADPVCRPELRGRR